MTCPFTILQPLNAGGNADLFLGRLNDSGTVVVIKFLREYHLLHARSAFEREVRVLQRRVEGLIPVLFADLKAPQPYYGMPYLRAGSLTQFAGKLTHIQLHAIATDLARTLGALHAGFVTHGDIKPDNIMVSDNGQLRVADPLGNGIGCTVLFSENHGGTPGYWAPEIRAGAPISQAGDSYSYGATLYQLSTGHRPTDGQPPVPNRRHFQRASQICEVIMACCQPQPDVRPTMREVLRVLNGQSWAEIQIERKQLQQLVGAACIFGGILLFGRMLAA
jgi:serine/threonine protein kinase